MTSVRVGCFATAMLGFLYSVLALMGGVKTDVIAGLVVALVGIVGWGISSWIEERR
jgi:type III secretory pathway component EscV